MASSSVPLLSAAASPLAAAMEVKEKSEPLFNEGFINGTITEFRRKTRSIHDRTQQEIDRTFFQPLLNEMQRLTINTTTNVVEAGTVYNLFDEIERQKKAFSDAYSKTLSRDAFMSVTQVFDNLSKSIARYIKSAQPALARRLKGEVEVARSIQRWARAGQCCIGIKIGCCALWTPFQYFLTICNCFGEGWNSRQEYSQTRLGGGKFFECYHEQKLIDGHMHLCAPINSIKSLQDEWSEKQALIESKAEAVAPSPQRML